MKMNYKKIFTIGLTLLFVTVILVPALILAQPKGNGNGNGDDDSNGNVGSNGSKGFCGRVSKISSDAGQKFGNSDAKLEQKREQIRERIEENCQERDKKYEEKREKWNDNRAEHFAKLDERAGTEEQKRVALEFKEAVGEAIRTRREAVDAAIEQFRQGVENAKNARKVSTNEAITAFRNSSEAAIGKAQTSCGQDSDPKTVQERLRNELKTAKQEYVKARQRIQGTDTDTEPLVTAKREAIQKAQKNFKQALEQARDNFKADFPEDEEDEETED